MKAPRTLLVLALGSLVVLTLPLVAGAKPTGIDEATSTFEYTKNMKPMGFSPRMIPDSGPGSGVFNSDLAFQGDVAVQGTYAGFRLIDVSSPAHPREIINWEECAGPLTTAGNQGDVIIWEDLIIRSWNSPVTAANAAAGTFCGDWQMFQGQEGVHIIDISDMESPDVIGFVETPCGSHTETLVPDLENDRLLVYSNPSASTFLGGDPEHPDVPFSCRGIDIIEVPLADPASASYLRFLPAGAPGAPHAELHPCHDTGVILGDVNLAACAGGSGVNVFSLDPADGGSKERPVWLYHKATGGVGIGHSASFSWDGKVLIIGHEPGGGSAARCQVLPPPSPRQEIEHTYFFLDARTGDSIGQLAMPRPQGPTENCTVHNYNVVPTDKRYVLVAGNYQSGISVVDFTDPANAYEFAYADPAPLVHPTNPETGILLGGDWSTYWYNGRIYESDIRRGMMIWNLNDPHVAGAKKLERLNPQTQEFSFEYNVRPNTGQAGTG